MRNWNAISHSRASSALRISSLPMRNWNAAALPPPVPPRAISSLPMRNWNSFLPLTSTRTQCISSLPMRNWNATAQKWHLSYGGISSLPMRNWNPNGMITTTTVRLFPAYLWGIETLVPQKRAVTPLHFQPTYEELKLTKYLLDFILPRISSLPMRNWNGSIPHRRRPVGPFPAYLWGIETRRRRHRMCRTCEFPAYLWGIETSAYAFTADKYTHFQPTYEELKL